MTAHLVKHRPAMLDARRRCGLDGTADAVLSAAFRRVTLPWYCIIVPTSAAASYTLTDAARVTGKSRVTMRRYLDADRFPHAFRPDGDGSGAPVPWLIPEGDLVAAGLDVEPARAAPPTATQPADTPPLDLAISPSHLEQRAAVATAIADERARTIDMLTEQLAELRALLADALATVRAISAPRS